MAERDVRPVRETKSSSADSGSDGGDCVEVAATRLAVHVRDTKTAGQGPALRVGHAPWAAFVAHTGT
ncbi:DUF397 domain-containing protein [Streptomyces nitrosporeus]|uniref:DUF397 domain-containing protein n=1 Tax=Streptomyces nitrosporeus TaxID=28894 RepID=UPI0039A384A2